MDVNQQILSILKRRGPSLPAHISKEINDSILMTSARLSELSSKNEVKISNIKVGGSPLYFIPGQEEKLQDYSENLGDIELKAYELLKRERVVRENVLEPAVRVALRSLKDFAVPLQVQFEQNSEIFWKWYLLGKEETEKRIHELLEPRSIPSPRSRQESVPEAKKEQPQTTIPDVKKEPPEQIKPTPPTKKPDSKPKKPRRIADKELFLQKTQSYFSKKNISLQKRFEGKSSDIDSIIELETSVGTLTFFCRAKKKAKINDSDLSTALVAAQSHNLPLLFLSSGTLTKKAEEMLSNQFKNIKFHTI